MNSAKLNSMNLRKEKIYKNTIYSDVKLYYADGIVILLIWKSIFNLENEYMREFAKNLRKVIWFCHNVAAQERWYG